MGLGWQALGVFLGAEALGCVVLILPLPLDTKRSLLQFLSSNPHVAKAQSYLWVIFFLLLALFADSLREAHLAGGRLEVHNSHSHEHGGHDDMHALEAHLYASQRNALLTGVSLFLLVLLGRFVNVVTALFKLEQNAEILSKQAKNQESAFVQHAEENEKLRKELEEQKAAVAESQAKLTQTKMMAKQVENQQKEYLRVLDENERLQKEVQDLTDRLTAKSSQGKKDD